MSKKKRRFKSNQDPSIIAKMKPFQELGAVLEAVRFPLEEGQNGYDIAREKVAFGMKVLIKREKSRVKKQFPNEPLPSPFYYRMIEGRRAEGRKISFQELWGKGVDLEGRELNMFQYSTDVRSQLAVEGLGHALLNPPYALQWPGRNERFSEAYGIGETVWFLDLIDRFNQEILALERPLETDHLEVYAWSTDWSTYFHAGHDWWGAFCWTILDKKNGWLTMLAASTTD